MNDDNPTAPEHWADLSAEQRAELVAMADARITSRRVSKWFWKRVERVKGFGTLILTLAAVWTLLGDQIASWVNSWLNK